MKRSTRAVLPDEPILRAMVEAYFRGLHEGTADTLAPLFHPDCVLKVPGQRRSMEAWLTAVSERPVPANEGHPWRYRLLWLEQEGEQAMAKVACPLPHGDFIDYLGFLKEDGQWRIVNKMYAQNPTAGNERRYPMPYVNIKITDENVTPEKLEQLIEGTTQLLVDTLNKDPATTHVVIDVVPTQQWGVRGQTVARLRQQANET